MLQEEMLKTLLLSSRCSSCSAAIPLVTPCSWHSQRLQKADCAGGGGRFSLASTKPSLAVDNLEAIAKNSRNSAAKVLKDGFCVLPYHFGYRIVTADCNPGMQDGDGEIYDIFFDAQVTSKHLLLPAALSIKIIAYIIVFPQTVCPLRGSYSRS